MAGTHYDTLGISPDASLEEIRLAYHHKARQLHPDGLARQPEADVSSQRAMQDVNEAWRVLREPGARATYDQSLHLLASAAVQHVDTDLDRTYPRPVAEPGDLTVAVVRAVPWVALLIVLGAIVVFTAFARRTEDQHELIGRCINTSAGVPEEAPCDEPNDGRVVRIVDQRSSCPADSTPRVVANGNWFCLRSPEAP